MKHVKHLLVAALTVFMAAVLAVPAYAAGHTISVSNDDTHTYKVYQVLTGTLSEAGSKELGNPAWGSAVTPGADGKVGDYADAQAFVDAIKNLSGQDLAEAVAGVLDTDPADEGTLSKGNAVSDLATGYYILVDVTTPLTNDDGTVDTKALHVIKVLNDVDGIEIKWGTTEDKKEIVSDTLGKDEGVNEFAANTDTDNVSIGDTVNYKITATIPENANLFNYFYFVINDTLSDGLSLDKTSIVVYKDSVNDANKLTAGTDYNVQYDVNDHTFEVGLLQGTYNAQTEIKPGDTIIVTYSAVLNENAEIGEESNDNTSTVTFSNNPNHDYDGQTNPGFPAEKEKDALGETPESTTETYTTGLEIQKVDQDGKPLTGVEFTISGTSTKTVLKVEESFVADANGDYYKLKNGKYTKEAPSTEQTMEPAESGATSGYVVAEEGYEGTDAITIGGITYRPVKANETPTHILVNGNADQYEEGTYKKVVGEKTELVTTQHSAKAYVDANGIVRFDGLGAGTYTISETDTPEGYNTLDDLDVVISFDKSKSPKWSTTTSGASYDQSEGVIKLTIENNKGTTLPETGGMGTTILYIVGGCMIAAGVVMFLTKRRMASLEQ